MAYVIGVVSQKGGVGKSTLCRLLAREFIAAGWTAKIIDTDTNQSTCFEWAMERNKNGVEPYIPVQQYPRVDKALESDAAQFDVLLIDGKPNSDRDTLKIAESADLVIVPTGVGRDDTQPTKRLVDELVSKGISKEKITLALCKVTGTAEDTVAQAYHDLSDDGYDVLEGATRFQAAYIRAFNMGKTATETSFKTLNDEAAQIGNCVVARLERLQKGRAA